MILPVKCKCKEEIPLRYDTLAWYNKVFNMAMENLRLTNYPPILYDATKAGSDLEHEHKYNEQGLCDCGDVWEEDDFSGATPGDR